MRRWLKRLGLILAAASVAALIAAFVYRDELVRLYRVNTLFKPDRIVANFSNMTAMFPSATAPKSGPAFTFAKSPAPLPTSFAASDGEMNVAAFLEATRTTSLLVIRDDRIEHESYFEGTGPDDLRISWSIAKSFLSTLVGAALADGAIESFDDPVVKYAPSLTGSAYDGATVRNVANMASGVAFNEDYLDYNSDINRMGRILALGGSLDAFAAEMQETVGPPGAAWRYVSIDTHVLGMVLRGATGRTVADYMADKLWSRIGPERDAVYLTDAHGAAFVLGGLNMPTRDYAKLGRLYLNDGLWEGERVLPASWTRDATTSNAPPPGPDGRRGQGYGSQWWLPPDADGEFYGIGVYGQYLWVDRKAKTIIVKTSADVNFRADDGRAQLDSIALFRAISRP